MEFRMLGPIEVVGDAGPVRLGGENARAILAALMLQRGRGVSSESLVHAVWQRPPATAGHAVAVYVSRLRQALATAGADRERIVTRGAGYALEIEPEELDLELFRAAATRGREALGRRDWATAWTTLDDALGMWRATPLACLTTSPLIDARFELDEERLSVVEDRFHAGLELGLHHDLVSDLRSLTREHPERERAWSALMLALYRSGRQGEALEVFLEARRQLDTSFGIEPGPALRELQRQILDQDSSLELPIDRAESISLPAPPSSFIGRENDLNDAAALLSEPDVRLVTIVGPGGIGKTRFSIELARRLAHRFPDGVAWVALDAVDDATRVPEEIAVSVLGGPAGDPLDALSGALRGKRTLLLLDCFEHVIDAATDVHRLLARIPALRMVVTSRERLGLSGEQLFWLPPLTQDDAAALFRARRRAVSRATPPDDEVLEEVCERLDRLPLAIELVASQLETRTRDELFATLERSLDVDGRRDPPLRHRTLRTTLDWSFTLLDEDERRVLRHLSVFAGGFTPEGAEAVTGATHARIDRLEKKSLVTRHDAPGRYRLLDTVRAYATERLEECGESVLVGDRHAAWYADLGRALEPKTWDGASVSGHAIFDAELPNFRLALHHAVENDDGRMAAVLVRSLAPYLYAKVSAPDGRKIARSTLSLPGADAVDRGHVLYYDAAISMDMGLADETRAALAEAEELFAGTGDAHGLSMVENLRCFHEATVGNYSEAYVAGERACAYARDAGSDGLEGLARSHLAFALLGLGTAGPVLDEAAILRCVELTRSAIRRAEDSGNPYALVMAHGNIVCPLLELGELNRALTHVRRVVELHLAHAFRLPYVLVDAADAASRMGQHGTAIRLLSAGLEDLTRNAVALHAYTATRIDAIRADARAALGAEAFATAEHAGKALTVADALELALTLDMTSDASTGSGAYA
ncbi:MAG TPA: BTAD domain-containing putative transcriptional regulator [Gaiella sp.]|uniref:BTAD domain-containing putative transcriptional regulator n=1 Tax=Gaiella sp. TaxID=2663207 RepID=UPI002D7FD9F7|nr:BTAD domain-containing putative transcriptional regulator [Gaiella sp.]HET9287371.1 BTAD domain-containing putative transcriptional regulator [Gaiella sp.]